MPLNRWTHSFTIVLLVDGAYLRLKPQANHREMK
nr:MAG TPA: hypothetical protein [Caudoviricetes sp.]